MRRPTEKHIAVAEIEWRQSKAGRLDRCDQSFRNSQMRRGKSRESQRAANRVHGRRAEGIHTNQAATAVDCRHRREGTGDGVGDQRRELILRRRGLEAGTIIEVDHEIQRLSADTGRRDTELAHEFKFKRRGPVRDRKAIQIRNAAESRIAARVRRAKGHVIQIHGPVADNRHAIIVELEHAIDVAGEVADGKSVALDHSSRLAHDRDPLSATRNDHAVIGLAAQWLRPCA